MSLTNQIVTLTSALITHFFEDRIQAATTLGGFWTTLGKSLTLQNRLHLGQEFGAAQ